MSRTVVGVNGAEDVVTEWDKFDDLMHRALIAFQEAAIATGNSGQRSLRTRINDKAYTLTAEVE